MSCAERSECHQNGQNCLKGMPQISRRADLLISVQHSAYERKNPEATHGRCVAYAFCGLAYSHSG